MAATATAKTKATKIVFVAHELPEESLAHAQVAIVSAETWHLIAPNPYRIHSTADIPMPEVACPIVDIRGVKNEKGMRAVMEKCVDKNAGVINLDGLLTGLEALGAVVKKCQVSGVEVSKPRAQDVAIAFYERKKRRVARRVHGGKERVN